MPGDRQERDYQHYQRIRRRTRRRRRKQGGGWAVILAALVLCMGIIIMTSLGSSGPPPEADSPSPTQETLAGPSEQPTPTPEPTQTPLPTPVPTPPPYDYAAPAPEAPAVEMSYFADAVFIGDSRTDGLQLYSGIKGTTFLSYKGITVFDVMEREDKKVVTIDGEKFTILEALGKGSYQKVYVSLGVNELGYQDGAKFAEEYGRFIDQIRVLQPGAEIYVQSLVPVNPEKCKANNQPAWLTNEGIASYNAALQTLCTEKEVVFLNISEELTDEAGILPADATTDGLHFTKVWYKNWLEYLMTHTVDLGAAVPADPVVS
ncbi:MAG: hypothetical protein HFE97_10210 [Oscillospiraceae bacterium]|nr:hypothetical protein [Oscillospiraceae bacterium]